MLPDSWLEGINADPVRLWGNDRYKTNLAILKEAGVDKGSKIMVCTGKDFADSLSVSATGNPILLVAEELSTEQKAFLKGLDSCTYYMIGGDGVVSNNLKEAFREYGTTKRVAGKDRYATSNEVAKEFFPEATNAVLAYALDFPDGLSAGPLANAMGAPLILTYMTKVDVTALYTGANGIHSGRVMGGTTLISDEAVRTIFEMSSDTAILNK